VLSIIGQAVAYITSRLVGLRKGTPRIIRLTYRTPHVDLTRIANVTINYFMSTSREKPAEPIEIAITPEMVSAGEACAWDALSGRERFLSEASVFLILEAALIAGGFVVRDLTA
jgi:hypothetical protein